MKNRAVMSQLQGGHVGGRAGFTPAIADMKSALPAATEALHKTGFTLLEILVVVLIITILATIVGVSVSKKPGEARVVAATAQIRIFRTALQMYQMKHGRLPSQEQGLKALVEKPAIPPTPDNYPEDGYLDSKKLPKDPWGRDYVYVASAAKGNSYEIISYGADGEPGGDGESADISSADM